MLWWHMWKVILGFSPTPAGNGVLVTVAGGWLRVFAVAVLAPGTGAEVWVAPRTGWSGQQVLAGRGETLPALTCTFFHIKL